MRKNYLKLLGGILISLFLSTAGYSQADEKDCCFRKKEPATHTIEFDKDGKIISDLPERIEKHQKLIFYCKDSNELNSNLKLEMIKYLEQTYKSLSSNEAREKLKFQYPLFIQDDNILKWQDTTSYLDEIYKIKDEVKNEIAYLKGKDTTYVCRFIPKIRTNTTTYFEVKDILTNSNIKRNKLEFRLKTISMDSIFVYWLNENRPEILSRIELSKLDSTFKSVKQIVDSINKISSSCDSMVKAIKVMEGVDNEVKKILNLNLKPWLLKWIWKNGETFNLNPIELVRKKVPDSAQIKTVANIPVLEARINALIKILDNKSDIDGKLAIVIADSIGKLSGELLNAKLLKDEFEKLKNMPEKTYFRDNLLYKGFFYTSTDDRNFYMRHHDASNDYEIMGKLRKYYLEDFKVKYLVQNQTADKETKLYESVTESLDYSKLTEGLLEAISTLSNVDFEGYLKNTNLIVGNKGMEKHCSIDSVNLLNSIMENKRIKFNAARFKLNWLLQQGELDPIPQLVTDETPKYRTDEAGPSKNVEAPAKVTYVLRERPLGSHPDTVGTTVIDSVSYNVYALHRFQPFAGFAFGSDKRTILNIDENGKLISVENERKQNTFIGIKVYPKKTDIHNPKFITAKEVDCVSRINFLVGMDFSNINPVDNFIGGVGLDVFPGLNLAYYGNWYKNNTYKIEQGKFIKEGRPLMFDHGFMISLDPVVIFNFAKLIAKP